MMRSSIKTSTIFETYVFVNAGTFLSLGKKRGELEILWTRGQPKMACPHIQEDHQPVEQ
jgi:hypothetical protein